MRENSISPMSSAPQWLPTLIPANSGAVHVGAPADILQGSAAREKPGDAGSK